MATSFRAPRALGRAAKRSPAPVPVAAVAARRAGTRVYASVACARVNPHAHARASSGGGR